MFNWFKSKQKSQIKPEIEGILRKIESFLESDAAQNVLLPDPVKPLVIGGINCDKIPGGSGDFGRSPTNPIPVNGSMGQVLYLSRLRTATLISPHWVYAGRKGLCGHVRSFVDRRPHQGVFISKSLPS